MKLNKVVIELTEGDAETLMNIFKQYIINLASLKGNWTGKECQLIKAYMEKFLNYQGYTLLEHIYERRKEHIEWLFEDDCGECHIKLPQSLDEFKKFLYEYDMDFLGND